MKVVLNVRVSFRTTGSDHNREVVVFYRWPLHVVQVPLYNYDPYSHVTLRFPLLKCFLNSYSDYNQVPITESRTETPNAIGK